MSCVAAEFAHVRSWIFDLDNTLYPARCQFMAQVEARITEFVCAVTSLEASRAQALQSEFCDKHGTTLAGLMACHGVEPATFLDYVHDVPLDRLRPDPALRSAIERLPGRRVVFTNASLRHAERVLGALDLSALFEAICHIEGRGHIPKPATASFRNLLDDYGVDPRTAVFFDDDERNLQAAEHLGMTVVLVGPAADGEAGWRPHHRTEDLAGFLGALICSPV